MKDLLEQRCAFDRSLYASLLRKCGETKALVQGKRVHAHIQRWSQGGDRNTYLGNFLIQMYGKCSSLVDALRIFERLPQPNVFSWNFMLAAYAENGQVASATQLFEKMPQRDVVSWTTMLNLCAEQGSLAYAVELFTSMPERNVVSWNAMVAAYATSGLLQRSLFTFKSMLSEGFRPNLVTFLAVLDACSHLSEGKTVHSVIRETSITLDSQLETSLVNMYGRCGSPAQARTVFDSSTSHRDFVSWNSMLCAYGHNGLLFEAVAVYRDMNLEGFNPVDMTFSSLLAACSHRGTVAQAREMFMEMVTEYNLSPNIFHYKCLVDALARSGHLDQAKELLHSMPFEPDVWSWRCVLAACQVHGDIDEGESALHQVKALEGSLEAAKFMPGCAYVRPGRASASTRRDDV